LSFSRLCSANQLELTSPRSFARERRLNAQRMPAAKMPNPTVVATPAIASERFQVIADSQRGSRRIEV
jgi:hypothetical protein